MPAADVEVTVQAFGTISDTPLVPRLLRGQTLLEPVTMAHTLALCPKCLAEFLVRFPAERVRRHRGGITPPV